LRIDSDDDSQVPVTSASKNAKSEAVAKKDPLPAEKRGNPTTPISQTQAPSDSKVVLALLVFHLFELIIILSFVVVFFLVSAEEETDQGHPGHPSPHPNREAFPCGGSGW